MGSNDSWVVVFELFDWSNMLTSIRFWLRLWSSNKKTTWIKITLKIAGHHDGDRVRRRRVSSTWLYEHAVQHLFLPQIMIIEPNFVCSNKKRTWIKITLDLYIIMCYHVILLCVIMLLSSCVCRTLAQFLAAQERPMEEKDILLMFQQIVAAIRHIHEHNILHRYVHTLTQSAAKPLAPLQVESEFRQNTAIRQVEQDPYLPSLANIVFWAESSHFNKTLF